MSTQDYEIHIRPLTEQEGGGYPATVPEPAGCKSDGATPQEALEKVLDAIGRLIEAAEEMGRAVPPPRRLVAEPRDFVLGRKSLNEIKEVRPRWGCGRDGYPWVAA